MHTITLAGVKCAAANEGLTDHVAGYPDAVGVTDEDRVDVRIVDPVALDRDVSILEIVLKAIGAVGNRHADIDGAQCVAIAGQGVGTGDAVGEMVVPNGEVVGKSRLRPEADVAARLERDSTGIGELAGFDDGVRRLDEDAAAGMEAAAPDRRAGANPAQ